MATGSSAGSVRHGCSGAVPGYALVRLQEAVASASIGTLLASQDSVLVRPDKLPQQEVFDGADPPIGSKAGAAKAAMDAMPTNTDRKDTGGTRQHAYRLVSRGPGEESTSWRALLAALRALFKLRGDRFSHQVPDRCEFVAARQKTS
jgi:hypothetical protein